MTDAIIAPVGHNGGPPLVESRYTDSLKYRWALALFADPDTPATVIAMSWAIHWYSKWEGTGAALSNEQFSAMCGLSESSVTRGKKWLLDHGYVSIRVGKKGAKSQFQLVIPKTTKPELVVTVTTNPQELVVRETANDEEIGAHSEDLQEKGSHSDGNRSSHRAPIAQIGAHSDALRGKDKPLVREKEESADAPEVVQEVDEPVVYQRRRQPKADGRAFWQKQLTPSQEHQATALVEGRVQLLNGTRQEWVRMFQGDEEGLDLALIEISGKIQTNSNRSLDQQVMSYLAAMVRDKRDRDARYQKGIERNSRARVKVADEDAADIAMRSLKAAVERKNARAGGRS